MGFMQDVEIKVNEILSLIDNENDDMKLLNELKAVTDNCRLAYMYTFNYAKAYRLQKTYKWKDTEITDYRNKFSLIKVRGGCFIDIIWNDNFEWNVVDSETREVKDMTWSKEFLRDFLVEQVKDHVISTFGVFSKDGINYIVQMSSLYKKQVPYDPLFREISFEEFEEAYCSRK
jgi:hypothetical protein